MKLEWHAARPNSERNVLATDGSRLLTAFYLYGDGWFLVDENGWYKPCKRKIIAWAEMPKFPKIGEEIPEVSDEAR